MTVTHPTPVLEEWMQSVSAVIELPYRAARPFTLGEAVTEIELWARDARDEAWNHGGNQASLDRDIATLTTALGPQVLAVVSDLLPDLTTTKDRSIVAQAAANFTARWTRPSTIGAAFRDLCQLAAAAGTTMADLEPRARIIASQLGEESHGFGLLAEIRNLLSAEPNEWQLGIIRSQDELFTDDSAPSRVAAAERLLSADRYTGAVVVWSVYRRARIPWRTPAGPITFLRATYAIHDALADDRDVFPERNELRALLQNPGGLDGDRIVEDEGRGESFVLVRTDLGQRSPLGAADEAERRIDALLNIAAGAGGVSWVNTGTAVTVLDGEPVRSSLGADHQRREPFSDDYGIGATSELIEAWSKKLESAMAKGPMPDPLLEALAAVKEARLTDHRDVHFYDTRPVTPRVATALEDHALEQVASLAQMKPEALMDELMFQEAEHAWGAWLAGTLTAPLRHRDEDAEFHRKREAVDRKITQRTSYGARSVHLDKAWEARDELRELAGDPATRADLELALSVISDQTEEARSKARLLDDTSVLRNRHRRVRNAVAHGNPVTAAALDSVRHYSESVTGDALAIALESYATSRPVADICADRHTDRAKDDPSLGSILDRIAAAAATATSGRTP